MASAMRWSRSRMRPSPCLSCSFAKPAPWHFVQVSSVFVARLTQEAFDKERTKTLDTCTKCHGAGFAKEQLKQGDGLIRDLDHLMAEAIRVVAGLYQDGSLAKPANYASAFPDLLTFHDAPTPVEQKLFVMFLEHRMRAFQGAFHANPDYVTWYGWSEMQRDLTEIRAAADELRRAKKVDAQLEAAAKSKK